jgi:hypothetical protein
MQLMVACTDELMDQALSEHIMALHSGECHITFLQCYILLYCYITTWDWDWR